MGLRRTAKKLDDVDVIDTTVHKTYRWIDEISEQLGGIGRREAMTAEEFVEVFIERAVVPPEREPLASLKAPAHVLE